jgi:hypothetical protein
MIFLSFFLLLSGFCFYTERRMLNESNLGVFFVVFCCCCLVFLARNGCPRDQRTI